MDMISKNNIFTRAAELFPARLRKAVVAIDWNEVRRSQREHSGRLVRITARGTTLEAATAANPAALEFLFTNFG